ncbi:hypothetical protein ND748_04810 [Frankia sp. AiPs1]|uniref:hypothetical protein n=1 Tax=Frankia sp. AiPs1 TaxID=573493 RepID=UPI002043C241|nr:hypothetical protein [Frankia sp. AiPs1]MCM3920997.1 hypothetical protein [Frankia sp. AiPs1]
MMPELLLIVTMSMTIGLACTRTRGTRARHPAVLAMHGAAVVTVVVVAGMVLVRLALVPTGDLLTAVWANLAVRVADERLSFRRPPQIEPPDAGATSGR